MKTTIPTVVFLALLKCISISCTNRPIIGILAQEISQVRGVESFSSKGGNTYIGASYVKAVESSGARAVPIFVNRPYSYYERLLESINGVVIPGGNAEIQPGYPYYDAFTTIMKISEQMNKKGIYFPVLSVCLGFEAIITLYNENKLTLARCNIHHENYPLKFEPKFTESLLFSDMDQETYINFKYFPITVNNHAWCSTLKNFTKARNLSKNWKITSTSVSSRGMKFIATIEHKKYPFFATQFHPEKAIFEWAEELNLPHSKNSIQSNRYFYDRLVKLSKLNSNKFKSEKEERDALIYNYNPLYPDIKPLVFAQIYVFD